MNDLLRDKALEALELAARQNGHDMLLTGEELRKVEDAITSLRAAAPEPMPGIPLSAIADATTKQPAQSDVLARVRQLCEWIAESPHQRGSINGLAAQVGHALATAPAAPAAPVVTADAVRDLLKVASEMLELADNWPGIAYSHNLDARARAAIAFVRAAMQSTEAREEKK